MTMPKSKRRKKSGRNGRSVRRSGNPARGGKLPPARYDVGRVRSPDHILVGLLLNDDVAPDLLVDLLPAALWMYENDGTAGNRCIDAAATLHYTYGFLGITAEPRPVDLVVSNQRTGQNIQYGRPDPRWSDSVFEGHCVIHLPDSKRFIDPTVEQYPEVRRFRIGPICGRTVAAQVSTPDQLRAIEHGELPPGTHMGVQREHLLLLYTVADAAYDQIIMASDSVRSHEAELRRSGMNLAAKSIDLLRNPNTAQRARRAPRPAISCTPRRRWRRTDGDGRRRRSTFCCHRL
jgi:hypothetical protein